LKISVLIGDSQIFKNPFIIYTWYITSNMKGSKQHFGTLILHVEFNIVLAICIMANKNVQTLTSP